jgi:hypothetical protein
MECRSRAVKCLTVAARDGALGLLQHWHFGLLATRGSSRAGDWKVLRPCSLAMSVWIAPGQMDQRRIRCSMLTMAYRRALWPALSWVGEVKRRSVFGKIVYLDIQRSPFRGPSKYGLIAYPCWFGSPGEKIQRRSDCLWPSGGPSAEGTRTSIARCSSAWYSDQIQVTRLGRIDREALS